MAGITAQSASKSLLSGETIPDNTTTNFLVKEQISLGISPSPQTVLWSISKPYLSNTTAYISDNTSYNPVFTPDKDGIYTVSCLVDSTTTYVLRINVLNVSEVTRLSSLHLMPCSSAQIVPPNSGGVLFWSSDTDSLSIKYPNNSVEEVQTL